MTKEPSSGRAREPGSRLVDAALKGALYVLLAFRRLQSLLPSGGKRRKAIEDLASSDPGVRQSAASRLGDLKHPAAIEPLVRLLDDPVIAVRRQGAFALGEIGPVAGPLVLQSLAGASPRMRAALFEALGRIRSGEGAAAAVAALSDPDPEVRVAAAEALQRISEPQRGGRPERDVADVSADAADDSAAPDLIRGLRAREPEVRLASAQALGELRHRPAASELLSVMRDRDEDAEVRGAAAIALGRIGEERALEPILAMLDDEELEGYAAEALHAMGRGLAELLQKMEASPRSRRGRRGESARARAVRALGALGDPGAVGPLLRSAGDPDPAVRAEVARALDVLVRHVGPEGDVEPEEWARLRIAIAHVLTQLLSDADAAVRLSALDAHLDPPSRGRLAVLTADADARVRARACRMLGRLGARRVVPRFGDCPNGRERVRPHGGSRRARSHRRPARPAPPHGLAG